MKQILSNGGQIKENTLASLDNSYNTYIALDRHYSLLACTQAAFPAGVDLNRGSEETVRNPRVL